MNTDATRSLVAGSMDGPAGRKKTMSMVREKKKMGGARSTARSGREYQHGSGSRKNEIRPSMDDDNNDQGDFSDRNQMKGLEAMRGFYTDQEVAAFVNALGDEDKSITEWP